MQVFSWEYSEIFKNRFYIEHLRWLFLYCDKVAKIFFQKHQI